jgi:hypothetical protein
VAALTLLLIASDRASLLTVVSAVERGPVAFVGFTIVTQLSAPFGHCATSGEGIIAIINNVEITVFIMVSRSADIGSPGEIIITNHPTRNLPEKKGIEPYISNGNAEIQRGLHCVQDDGVRTGNGNSGSLRDDK